MSDEAAAPEGATTAPETFGIGGGNIQSESEANSQIANDGNIQTPTFQESLPEAYRDNPSLSTFKSMDDLLKSYTEQRSMLGKKGMMKPGEDASDEERAAWRQTIGVPDSIDGYGEYEFPVDDQGNPLLEINNEEFFNSAKSRMHEANFTPEQVKLAFDLFSETTLSTMDEAANMQQQMANESLHKLREEWRDDFEPNRQSILNYIDKNGFMEFAEESGIINNYNFIKMMEKVVRDTKESNITGDHSLGGGGFDEAVARIKNSEAFKAKGHPQHAEAQAQLESLYRKRYS